jgi:hypothetical protein
MYNAITRIDCSQLREYGYTANELMDFGFKIPELIDGGYQSCDIPRCLQSTPISYGDYQLDSMKNKRLNELCGNLPKLDKPYTKMLNDIEYINKTEAQMQAEPHRSFYPKFERISIKDYLIILAKNTHKEAIKELMNLDYDMTETARILHYNAHPKYPPPTMKYNKKIPYEWGLSYIKYMAKIEASDKYNDN